MQAWRTKNRTSRLLVLGVALLALFLPTGCSAPPAFDPQVAELLVEGPLNRCW